LATCEHLYRLRRQAVAVVMREIYEGFDLPIGVWFVRENLRRMYSSRPLKFDTVEEALSRLAKATKLPLDAWLRSSRLLRSLLTQEALDAFMGGQPW
ncbi:MAG: hypothetical protein DRK00_11215, partial [Thermoprotei archaeon]